MENKVLALFASFIAMSFVVTSYFVKKKSMYLLFQALCIIFLVISYFFTVQFFAMVGLGVGLIRTFVFFAYEKKDKPAPIWTACGLALLTLTSYFTVNFWILKEAQPLDILLLVGLIMYAFIFRIRDLKTVRFTMPVPTVLCILYNTLSGAALFVSLSYTFELAANVVSIYKDHILPKEKRSSYEKY